MLKGTNLAVELKELLNFISPIVGCFTNNFVLHTYLLFANKSVLSVIFLWFLANFHEKRTFFSNNQLKYISLT